MRSFALAALCGLTAARSSYGATSSRNYGTTGHYGNQFGHGGNDDHDHGDHIYGYDSVPVQKVLRSGDAQTRNETKRAAIQTRVDEAQAARLAYLDQVKQRRLQRFVEIRQQNRREISAPFDYQTNLLEKEQDDVTVALTEAVMDSNAAYDDMLNRMTRLYDDKIAGLTREIDLIIDAVERAVVDHKDGCEVLFAMRLDILKNITCDSATQTATYDVNDPTEFREYEGMFDDFHYDIGHGKGTGEGNVDAARVRDGRSGSAPVSGPIGDYEVDVGATTRTWEGNLYSQGKSY